MNGHFLEKIFNPSLFFHPLFSITFGVTFLVVASGLNIYIIIHHNLLQIYTNLNPMRCRNITSTFSLFLILLFSVILRVCIHRCNYVTCKIIHTFVYIHNYTLRCMELYIHNIYILYLCFKNSTLIIISLYIFMSELRKGNQVYIYILCYAYLLYLLILFICSRGFKLSSGIISSLQFCSH